MVEEAKKWQGSCASGRTGRPSPAFAGEGRRFEAGHRPEGSKRGGEARQDGSGRSGPIRESAGQVAKAGEQRFERRFGGIRRARAIGLLRGQGFSEQALGDRIGIERRGALLWRSGRRLGGRE